jgi:hypothetical protein
MPGILDRAVARVKATGQPAKAAWPIAVAAMQKAGNLRQGSLKPTKQGVARGEMTPAQRAKTRG